MRIFRLAILSLAIISLLVAKTNATPATLQNSVERYDPGKTANDIAVELGYERPQPPPSHLIMIQTATPDRHAPVKIKFHLKKIKLTGNTVFSTETLSKLYLHAINTDVTFAELEDIAQRITNYYHKCGYVLAQANISLNKLTQDGTATFQIIEGYINSVTIIGCNNENVRELVQAYGYHIQRQVPLKYSTIERFTYLANDIPGVKVRTVIVPSQSVGGSSDLTFYVDERKMWGGGYGEFNNMNPEIIGRQQLIGNVYLNNLAMASQTAFNGIITNSTRMHYESFTHKQQLNSNGFGGSVLISNTHTDADMSTIGLAVNDIWGQAFLGGFDLNYAWIKSQRKDLYIGAGFKFLNSTTMLNGATFFKDDLRSLNFYITYDFMQNSNNFNSIALIYTQGFNIFYAQGKPPSIPGECLTYTKLSFYASNRHNFNESKYSYIALKAQIGFNVMPSSETFSYGGVPFGSGYDRSQMSGDSGIAGVAEFHIDSYANHCYKLTSEFYGFADVGAVWNIYGTYPPSNQYGMSIGAGYKVDLLKHIKAAFIVAQPLRESFIDGVPNYTRLLFDLKIYV